MEFGADGDRLTTASVDHCHGLRCSRLGLVRYRYPCTFTHHGERGCPPSTRRAAGHERALASKNPSHHFLR